MAKILIIEDDAEQSDAISEYLNLQLHVMDQAFDGPTGLEKLQFYKYELIILDWDLPGMSGLEICRQFRSSGGRTPVLFLTGMREIDDKTTGLDAGADDYLTKPFSTNELGARVRALLRRPQAVLSSLLQYAHIELDPTSTRVTSQGQPVKLVPTEFALLEFFMRNRGQVFSAEALLDRVWSSSSDATAEAITTCIKRLRKKLDLPGVPSIITTIHGRGYRLGD